VILGVGVDIGIVDGKARGISINVGGDDSGEHQAVQVVDGIGPGLHRQIVRVGIGMGLADGGEVIGHTVARGAERLVSDKGFMECHDCILSGCVKGQRGRF
jgi:hypothetical protein